MATKNRVTNFSDGKSKNNHGADLNASVARGIEAAGRLQPDADYFAATARKVRAAGKGAAWTEHADATYAANAGKSRGSSGQ
jgi:hypothetical protein